MVFRIEDQSEFVQSAYRFAEFAHDKLSLVATSRFRKYGGAPYIVHPLEVAALVSESKHDGDLALAAALLHDVMEDTSVTYEMLVKWYGVIVANAVRWLSDDPFGNREERKASTIKRLALAPDWVKTIKVADCLNNGESIILNDPNFAVIYVKEIRKLSESLVGADEALLDRLKFSILKPRLITGR